jgi:hypothetical protein
VFNPEHPVNPTDRHEAQRVSEDHYKMPHDDVPIEKEDPEDNKGHSSQPEGIEDHSSQPEGYTCNCGQGEDNEGYCKEVVKNPYVVSNNDNVSPATGEPEGCEGH